ncbi:hypothetical protein SAMN06893096_10512 [Geodermatophilus pulveris]|uniref:Uncharacterized protein n=1 Tax=Geodermatophilus pulveris TaxID=1564159 RepID=A0A239FBS0_9ACTN|nr:hypothetical protein [Geodermatophilus pulveris]SNS54277.1 hypothetical protein SAMN06893096_10512 [Geodermatophilus pulveris]
MDDGSEGRAASNGSATTRTTTAPAADPPELEWAADPIKLALDGSALARGGRVPEPFCIEVGRRLLLAQLEFSRWVLRRVETVSFGEGRSVLRRTTIELRVPDEAPVFVIEQPDGKTESCWLVPLTVMKRRTLVDFHLAKEDGTPITPLGLRLNQQLDESMLLAAAATLDPPGEEVRQFAEQVVAGDREVVEAAIRRYEEARWGRQLARLRHHALFVMTLDRLRYNFTQYVLLPQGSGRHRLLSMSFVEPVAWRYQHPALTRESDGRWLYEPMKPAPWNLGHLASELGLVPTRVRLQIPAAEHAASYHLEVEAPPGVRIVAATLLAGRPHEPEHEDGRQRFTLDSQRGDSLTVGLHGVEVPQNSLCRAHLELRVQRMGWLTTLLSVTVAVMLVLGTLAGHVLWQEAPDPDQDTNAVVLLIATSAAAAAFLSQRDFTGVAARLIVGMRAVGAASMALPVVAAGVLTYEDVTRPEALQLLQLPEPASTSTKAFISFLALASAALCALVAVTWFRTRGAEKDVVTSPWDQSRQARPDRDEEARVKELSYGEALKEYGFREPAVGVRSSEGWHHVYRWLDPDFEQASEDLGQPSDDRGIVRRYPCVHQSGCPRVGTDACAARVRARQPDPEATAAPGRD